MAPTTTKAPTKKAIRAIAQHQVYRLARISFMRPVCIVNIEWHNRVYALQAKAIKWGKGARAI